MYVTYDMGDDIVSIDTNSICEADIECSVQYNITTSGLP